MTIKFHCPSCDKFLKTADDKAGKRADCPGCGEPVTVPEISDEQYRTAEDEFGGQDLGGEIDYDEAYAGPADPPETKVCPMCGAEIKAAAVKCRYCGEEFGRQPSQTGKIEPTVIEIGEVMGTTWAVYKANFGLCFGVALLVLLCTWIAFIPYVVILSLIESNVLGEEFRALVLIPYFAGFLVSGWLTLGHARFMLNISKNGNASISDAFSGGRYFLRAFGAAIIFGLCYFLGWMFCIIPGIYIVLMWWPFFYVIVDQDEKAMASLNIAKDITVGNKISVIVLYLAVIGLSLLGLLALLIGILFVMPYVSLLWCITYLRMTGQRVAV